MFQCFVEGAISMADGTEKREMPDCLRLRCGQGGSQPALPQLRTRIVQVPQRDMRYEAPAV
ncbi:hypothetical protein RAA17_08290 [Komagataeibacter rhaeticus]|nr:hypothetical protein [Komagataeibacter rhaeticus]